MRKLIAAINMTLDGSCDHTAGIPDDEIHQHYADLLSNADTILYGRITYQLMEYWRPLLENPRPTAGPTESFRRGSSGRASDEKSMNDFAIAIDKIPKIVFSRTLKNVDWESATLANRDIEEEVLDLKQSRDRGSKDILVGSRSLIIQLMKLNLIDEYQLCIHPVIAGTGLPLFENIKDRTVLKLIKTKTFSGGAVILYYEPTNEKTTNR